ncbi:hypothetical protein LTR85_003343 [Meristemomyces frigidus]|nr:hypothetical protein LTR85_003343 [Meristemomyces frigidus]
MPAHCCALPSSAELMQIAEETLSRMIDADTPGFGCHSYPHVSAATPPTCPEACRTCSTHYLPLQWQATDTYAQKYADEDAREIVHERVRTTEQNLAYVREKLEAYGNAILKRWQKRSVDKRARLLRKAMPSLCEGKWFASRSTRIARACVNKDASYDAARRGWLLQYLSVEELSKDCTKLLALMHVRTAYTPAQWIAFDVDSQQSAFNYSVLDLGYNPHCVTVSEEGFGQLVQWDQEKAHRLAMVGFPRAHLAFEAQREVACLLRSMVDLLLGETGDQTPRGSDQWDASAGAGFDVSGSGVVAESAYYHEPYTAPCRFDADRIENLVLGRCTAAKDTLWLLQRDPLYFREFLGRAQSTSYHRQLLDGAKIDHLIQHTLNAINHVDHMSRMLEEVKMCLDIISKYQGIPKPGEPLAQEYDDALGLLRGALGGQYKTQSQDLFDILTHVSTFQHHFFRTESGTFKIRTTPDQALRTDKLFWNIMLLSDGSLLRNHRPAFHFTFIDEILANAPRREKERVDQAIINQLSDMAAIDEALVVVRSHRPNPTLLPDRETIMMLRQKYGLQYHHEMLVKHLAALDDAEEHLHGPMRELLALPMPSTKVSPESLLRTEKLHEAMCKFWAPAMVVKFEGLQGEGMVENDPGFHAMNLRVGRTDGYKKAKAAELDDLRRAIERKAIPAQARSAKTIKTAPVTSPAQTVWGATHTESKGARPTPKNKIKTRRAPAEDLAPALDGLQLDAEEPEPAQDQPAIAVGHDSLCLFQRMFTSAATAKSTSDVRWEDFVSALRDAGCSARQNGGSAIAFAHEMAPKDLVVVHRPHPDTTINPIMLRSFGKKLEKHFDWGFDTFVEREKEER